MAVLRVLGDRAASAAADVAGGLALSDAAGWNQTADDWAFFIAAGEALGIRDVDGRLLASAAALPYDGGVGWIAMVLVDADHRHRGWASRLLATCVESLARARPRAGARRDAGRCRGLSPERLCRRLRFERWQGASCARGRSARAVADPGVDLGDPRDGRRRWSRSTVRSAASAARRCSAIVRRADRRRAPGSADDGDGFVMTPRRPACDPDRAADRERRRGCARPRRARARCRRAARSSSTSRRTSRRSQRRARGARLRRASARSSAWRSPRRRCRRWWRARGSSPSPGPSSAERTRRWPASPHPCPLTPCARACSKGSRSRRIRSRSTPTRRLDRRRQRALARYYLDAGAGGLAVGVHTTQFAIREAGLFEEVLRIAAETARDWPRLDAATAPPLLVAGACGRPPQAIAEARLARGLGYDAVLLSLAALQGASDDALIAHCASRRRRDAADRLLPAAGGRRARPRRRVLGAASRRSTTSSRSRSRRSTATARSTSCAAWSRRAPRSAIALYTGNDDHIVLDLVTPFAAMRDGAAVTVRFRGGLLGHWSVWTRSAVALLERCKAAAAAADAGGAVERRAARARQPRHRLQQRLLRRRQRLSRLHRRLPRGAAPPGPARRHLVPRSGRRPRARVSASEIDRVCREHADLSDDAFVAAHLERWLG